MGLFNKLFKANSPLTEPVIQFGRFTDASKSAAKYVSWDKAVEHFEQEKYLQSYIHFFDYLSNENADNVKYKLNQGVLTFVIYQGSIVIEGIADFKKFSAKAHIVTSEKNNLPLMRYLLEANYELKFTKYAIEEDTQVVLIFDTMVEDSAPHKLYQALKELATEADRKDDVLINKFRNIQALARVHIRHISDAEIETKYNAYITWIDQTMEQIENGPLKNHDYPGAISYLILNLIYKIDYLIKPEGIIKEKIASCHEIYFNDNVMSVFEKNRAIVSIIKEIRLYTKDYISVQLYDVNSTFGVSKPEANKMLLSIIEAQHKDLLWYGNNYPEPYVKAICGYIIGHTLFAYAMPHPIKTLLHFYYKVLEDDYFNKLGFAPRYKVEMGAKHIRKQIDEYLKTWQDGNYPNISLDTKKLDCSGETRFTQSYIQMLFTLHYE